MMRKTQSTLKSRRMRMERLEKRSMLAVSVLPNAQTVAGIIRPSTLLYPSTSCVTKCLSQIALL